jgi:hypothetical protein
MQPEGSPGTDRFGNLLVADSSSDVIWVAAARAGHFYGRLMRAGGAYAIAGDGQDAYGLPGTTGDGGRATSAPLNVPSNPAVDHYGKSSGGYFGTAMAAGHIYRLSGCCSPPPVNGAPLADTGFGGFYNGEYEGSYAGSALDPQGNSTASGYGLPMRSGNLYTVFATMRGSFSDATDAGDATATLAAVNWYGTAIYESFGDRLEQLVHGPGSP